MKNHILPAFLAALLCAASCKPEDLPPTSVSVIPSSVSLVEGGITVLSVSVQPAEAVYSGITWTSSDTKVASVNNGVVMGVKAGSATITATADGVSGTATVTVNANVIAVYNVKLDKTELTMIEGENAQLTATVNPGNATDKSVSWKSSDDKIATVSSDGKVKAVKAGTATITVTTKDGNKTATCSVTVLENIEGALTGLFSVSDTKQVRFSKGNLKATYDGRKYNWGFAAYQFDYVGNSPGNTTINHQQKDNSVDLFGWSTASTYFGINTSRDSGDYTKDFIDWGKNIGNGSTWRTLSKEEWVYLFETRTNASNLCRTGVSVCGVTDCLIIAPDGFKGTIAESYNSSTWPAAEAAGLVCLPAVGCRYGYEIRDSGRIGYYWSSSMRDLYSAYHLTFISLNIYPSGNSRHCGCSVRLVTDVK